MLFVVVGIILGILSLNPARPAGLPDYTGFDENSVTPSLINMTDAAFVADSGLLDEMNASQHPDDFAGFILADMGSYLNTSPATSTTTSRKGLLIYRTQKDDTLSTIAANFGISVNTIIWANHIANSNLVKPGQEIVILPVSGILHEVRDGETLESIAKLYSISSKKITTFNKDNKISQGDTVIVPNVKPIKDKTASDLPSVADYLILPVENGWNWGKLHESAVDISAACGTPIYASAEGLVVEVGSPKNWNSGYGGYIKIKHPLYDMETLYAHNSVNDVAVGDYISQGKKIAKVGKTGLVQGPTGCHVHFGVFGAKNPFTK